MMSVSMDQFKYLLQILMHWLILELY
ncbi:UNVERIFIED_CONTAM: hypothetical protein GTU68_060874 [Idotea baltica]|nr:hypothetical protein [Idotea baltica]